MSVLVVDGYEIDFSNNTPGLADAMQYEGSATIAYVSGGSNDGYVALTADGASASAGLVYLLPGSETTMFAGCHFCFNDIQGSPWSVANDKVIPLLTFFSKTNAAQVTIGVNGGRKLVAYGGNNDGTLIATGSIPLRTGRWYNLVVQIVVDDAAGLVVCKLDGTTDISEANVDTNNDGDDILSVGVGPMNTNDYSQASILFDNLILNDADGSWGDTYPEGIVVGQIYPDADGTYTDWTQNGEATNYETLDDLASYGSQPDDDATYIDSDTTGQQASVTMSATGVSGIIFGAMRASYLRQAITGVRALNHFIRTGGGDVSQEDKYIGQDWGWAITIMPDNNTAQWTTATLSTVEFGWEYT
jgi:hypothetical protein